MRIIQWIILSSFCILPGTLSAQLFINEFMADNSVTISDDQGDFEDWIEIYNAGGSPVDLGGYYISDDLSEPTIWQIPTSNSALTTVPPGGFILLWADKDTDDGVLHVDIKLGSSGEDIVLVAPDGITIVDQLTFGPQNTDVSFGRSEDGGANFQLFTSPTPNTSNESNTTPPTFTVTINTEIESVNDDAIEYESSGGMDIDHFGMTMVETWTDQIIGLRFNNILLPQGAVIQEAYIQFTTKSPDKSTGYSNLQIRGELSGNADPFYEENSNISDRPLTNESITWESEEWLLVDESGNNQKTPNLASVFQEIMDQGSWDVGNSLAVIISGEGQRSAHNFTSGTVPTLRIVAEAPVPTQPVTDIYLNELASNGTEYTDEFGGHEDWIELYNDNDFPVSLGGLYLTDDIEDLTKWQISSLEKIPANGFLTIFADEQPYLGGLHADFKLSGDGETVALVQALNNELIIIDSITYLETPFKASAGRTTELADDWVIFGEPTPLAPNAGALAWLARPDISLDNGVFTTDQTVTIIHDDLEAEIRFTTDGSDPDEGSELYDGPITVSETGSIRARAFKDGHAPSQIRTRNYMFDASETLPVVMITTDPDNLWDDEIGIYTIGTNGIELGNCNNNVVANFWQDWERPANITFFDTDGDEKFSVDAGIKISGNCSRRYELKSLNIYLRNNQYGDKDIDYKLFPNRDFKKYKRLRLRSSGQDYRSTMMRDGTNHAILADITDVEYQNYRPAVVYINGEYFGIQNFRDLYGGDYFDAFFNVKEEDLDLIKSPQLSNDIKEGDDAHYTALYSFVQNNDLSDPQNYEYFKTQFDINNFIDYWATMSYMASGDWPANNLQIWRPRTPEGKWRYMYIDTDATTNLYGSNSTNGHLWDTYAEILDPTQQGWPFDSRSTLFLRKLLENEAFHDEFVQRTCSFVELIFSEARTHDIIDANAAAIDAEIGGHVERWAFDNPYLEDYDDWVSNLTKYKDFFSDRPGEIYHLIESNFNVNDTYELTFNYDENTNGDVFVNWNEMSVPYNYTGTYFTAIPLTVTAVADEGYTFLYWLETGDTDPQIEFIANFNATLTPVFELTGDICNPDSQDFLDADGDGVCDPEDECPGEDDTVDTNGNGIPDGCEDCLDGDDDNDGVCNGADQCPGYDDTIDTNNNGIPDGCEACTDEDNDGICLEDDCDDTNPNLPANPGTSCDDGNSNTTNDEIQSDGCTCQGTIIPPNGEYCDSEGEAPWQEWIAGVQLNDLNNSSGKAKYSDFTNLSATLNTGESYDLTLTAGYSWATYDEYFRVWIDYDQNGVFDELEEIAYSGIVNGIPNGTETGSITGSVTVPSTALSGTTRMRVSMQRNAYAPPCGIFPIGETEDYSIIINQGNGAILTLSNCPSDITATADFGQTLVDIDWTVPTATTTCDPDGTTLSQTDGPAPGSEFAVGTTTLISYTATDQCGNQQTCSFNVTIDSPDNGSVELSCPNNIELTLENGETSLPVSWPDATGSTTCPGGGLSINQTGGQSSGSSFSEGFYIIEYQGTDACGNSVTCSFSINILPEVPPGDYCDNESDFPWHEWIGGVQLNTINNISGKSSYSDFTNISTTLSPNETYDILLTTEYSWTTYDEYWKVWIDYNQNGTFEEGSETAFSGMINAPSNGTEFATITGQITIPPGALSGTTRMRVSMQRAAYPVPCNNLTFGEVEDYTVNIIGSGAGSLLDNEQDNRNEERFQISKKSLVLYPNPTNRILNVSAPKLEGLDVSITIYNHVGAPVKFVQVDNFPKSAYKIDFKKELINGFYYITLKAKNRKIISERFLFDTLD